MVVVTGGVVAAYHFPPASEQAVGADWTGGGRGHVRVPGVGGEATAIRVENGTGKSRPDRHRIPLILSRYRFCRKNRKTGKIRENPAKLGAEAVQVFS